MAQAPDAKEESKSDSKSLSDFAIGQKMIDANPVCADCDAKGPTWAVLNHGVLICIGCAGVHRSLGAHISKVRSIDGDKWTDDMIKQMCNGDTSKDAVPSNAEFNKMYEFNVNSKESKYYKPVRHSSRDLKDKYIRAKYESKTFWKNHEKNKGVLQASFPLFDPNPVFPKDENNKGKKDQKGMMETHGILDLLFMSATNLPIADVALVGGKSDPYVFCYQNNAPKKDKERAKFGTQIIESTVNPVWITEEDKKLLDQKKPAKNKDIKRIVLTVNENMPVMIQAWDYDHLSNDDLMCYGEFDILKECPKNETEYKIVKELTVVKEFQNQKKFKKHHKMPTIVFYAKYNKLF